MSNSITFGTAGSGKTFLNKRNIIKTLQNDLKTIIYVIDTSHSYEALAEEFDGQIIQVPIYLGLSPYFVLDPIASKGINFSSSPTRRVEEEYILSSEKAEEITCLFECLKGFPLHIQEKHRLEQVLHAFYNQAETKTFDAFKRYLLSFLHNPNATAEEQALAVYAGRFNGTCHEMENISGKRLFVYTLNDSYDVTSHNSPEINYALALIDIWKRVEETGTKYKHQIFLENPFVNGNISQYLFYLWKKARQYNVSFNATVQSADIIDKNAYMLTIMACTDSITILSQNKNDRFCLKRYLDLSPEEMNAIKESNFSEAFCMSNRLDTVPNRVIYRDNYDQIFEEKEF